MIFSRGSRGLNLWLQSLAAFAAMFLVIVGAKAETYTAHAERLLAEPPGAASIAEEVEEGILAALNAYRASKGVKPLKTADAILVKAARAHAMDLLTMKKVGHVSSTGHNFESRMRALKGGGLQMLPVMAENAARDRRTGVGDADKAQALVQQWIDSPRHRKSLSDRSFVAVAIGAVRDGDVVYAVQIFSGPQTKNNLFGSGN